MNAPLRHIAIACMVLFGLLMVNATYLQGLRADELRNKSGNVRMLYREYAQKRGPIVVDGKSVAYSTATKDDLKYLRRYPQGKLYAHATGFYSLFGSSGIEREKNDVLAGTDGRFFVRRMIDMATGKQPRGGSVVLSLNPAAQRAAYEGLQQYGRGAAVALDPQTGDILAMVSLPSYNPNRLAAHDSEKVGKAYEQLESSEARPLLNRTISEVYAPGSTFKVITAATALSAGYEPSTIIQAPHRLNLPNTNDPLTNFADEVCSPDGRMSLLAALRMSCNTAFANLGMELGPKKLREQAQKFGFGDTFEIPMESAASQSVETPIAASSTAQAAIGQYNVRSTPLQMAMVAGAIANDGMVMKPHLIEKVQGPDLATIDEVPPEEYGRAVSPEVAQDLTEMMKAVVEDSGGTGSAGDVSQVTVAGKTGTAEGGEDEPDTGWFISFAPANNPQVAVAVVMPKVGTTGGDSAAPIAQDIMKAVLQR